MSATTAYQNADSFYGCVPQDKSNTFVVEGGAPVTLMYQIRDAGGTPVDLTAFFPSGGDEGEEVTDGLFVWFSVADDTVISNHVEPARLVDAKNGVIKFELPEYVYNIPCIYSFRVYIGDKKTFPKTFRAKAALQGTGTVLVEWSPIISKISSARNLVRVVPSIEDVRRKLDDFVSKNDLLQQVEFSTDDIVHAMIRPVKIFNETTPRLRRYQYSLWNFPYYENWLIGTAAELLRIAAIHYTRNKLLASHGGIDGDEKRRDRDYLQLAEMYRQEYRNWCHAEKQSLNSGPGQGWGTLNSDYRFLQ
jgi:hypothetical protein